MSVVEDDTDDLSPAGGLRNASQFKLNSVKDQDALDGLKMLSFPYLP